MWMFFLLTIFIHFWILTKPGNQEISFTKGLHFFIISTGYFLVEYMPVSIYFVHLKKTIFIEMLRTTKFCSN